MGKIKTYNVLLGSFDMHRIEAGRRALELVFGLSAEEAQNVIGQVPVIILEGSEYAEAMALKRNLQNSGITVKLIISEKQSQAYSRIVWPQPPKINLPGAAQSLKAYDKIKKEKKIKRPVQGSKLKGVKGSVLAIEFNQGVLKFLQVLEKKGKNQIGFIEALDIRAKSDSELAEEIRRHVQKIKTANMRIVGLIPRELGTVRNAEIPSVDEQEVAQMVEFQAAKMVPFAKEEMIVDFQIIGKTDEGCSRVMLFIIKKDILERYLGIYSRAGIFPERLSINVAEICTVLNHYFLNIKREDISSFMLLDVDFCTSNIVMVNEGEPFLTRTVDIGLVHLEENKEGSFSGEQDLLQLAGEIKTTFTAARKVLNQRSFKRILIAGNDMVCSKLIPHLEKYGIPIENIDSLKLLEKGLEHERIQLGDRASFFALSSFALSSEARRVNLLPAEIVEKRSRALLKREVKKLAAVAAVMFIMLGLVVYNEIRYLKDHARRLEERVEATETKAKKVGIMRKKLEVMRSQIDSGYFVLDVLLALYEKIPPDVNLTNFEYEEGKNVSVKGSAKKRVDVYSLDKTLEDSVYFERTEIKGGISTRKVRGKELYDFNIVGRLAVK